MRASAPRFPQLVSPLVGLEVPATGIPIRCQRTPFRSEQVSARGIEMGAEREATETLPSCRRAVIDGSKDMPLEKLKRRDPEPELRPRPSCSC